MPYNHAPAPSHCPVKISFHDIVSSATALGAYTSKSLDGDPTLVESTNKPTMLTVPKDHVEVFESA